jgi:hypothetical protein
MTILQAILILILLLTARFILPAALTIIFGKIADRFTVKIR